MDRRVAVAAGLVALACGAAHAADPDALWKIVSGSCVPHQTDGTGGAPCALVDLAKGYAVLKDRNGATQYLMIPTTRIAGIESAELLAPGAPAYWEDAWAARSFVMERAGRQLPRDAIGLAINSAYGRSQNQLHIHVDCIREDVRRALREHDSDIGTSWSPFPVAFEGHTYGAIRIAQAELGDVDPFRLVADWIAEAKEDMGHETMVLTGTVSPSGNEGFILLTDRAGASPGDRGSGEELLDHGCAVAHAPT